MSGPVRRWQLEEGSWVEQSAVGRYVLFTDYETVVRELENVRTVKDSMIRIAKDLGEQCETLRALLDEAPHARDAARYAAWRDYILSNEERDELDPPDDVWMAQTAQEFDDAVDQWRAERTNLKSRLPRGR